MEDMKRPPETQVNPELLAVPPEPELRCDRCGAQMVKSNCKVICPNCGSRLDCSDLSLYFD